MHTLKRISFRCCKSLIKVEGFFGGLPVHQISLVLHNNIYQQRKCLAYVTATSSLHHFSLYFPERQHDSTYSEYSGMVQ